MRRPWNLAAAAVVLVIAGPGIAVLFPLWLLGWGCHRLCARRPPGPAAGAALLAASIVGLAAYTAWGTRHGEIFGAFAFTGERFHDYLQDYIVGGLFAASLVGFRGLSVRFPGRLKRIERPARWLAGATFTLYLFHQPLIHVLVAISPWPVTTWETRGLVYVVVPAIVLAVAEVTERRKEWWRQAFLSLPGLRAAAGSRP